MQKSTITIDVFRDKDNVPEKISWNATDTTAEMVQNTKAMCVAFWDDTDRSALTIDLWTKDMRIDEMADFFHQIIGSMARTFERATRQKDLSADMKTFANNFIKKFEALQEKENQQPS